MINVYFTWSFFSTLVGNRKISAKLFVPGLSYAKYAYELEAIISPNWLQWYCNRKAAVKEGDGCVGTVKFDYCWFQDSHTHYNAVEHYEIETDLLVIDSHTHV